MTSEKKPTPKPKKLYAKANYLDFRDSRLDGCCGVVEVLDFDIYPTELKLTKKQEEFLDYGEFGRLFYLKMEKTEAAKLKDIFNKLKNTTKVAHLLATTNEEQDVEAAMLKASGWKKVNVGKNGNTNNIITTWIFP